jgi:hypothetical protein
MITGRDLTPEERRKLYRTYRFSAISNVVAGLLWLGLGAFEVWRGRRDAYAYLAFALGIAFLVMAAVARSRSRKYM